MEEMFDILDDNGNLTGEIKPRSEVHRDGDWHKSVHIWILNGNGDVLLQQRSKNKDSNPNKFDISSAGHLSSGDTSLNAAVREIAEELGVNINPADLVFIKTLKRPARYTATFINNEFADLYILRTDLKITDFNFQKEELQDLFFVSYKKFKSMAADPNSNLLKHTDEFEILFNMFDREFDKEVFDELDENGVETGHTVARDVAHRDGKWHRAVVLFLVNSKRQVLLQKRSMSKKKWPGCWDISSGGHVDAGELSLYAGIRELQEELGITVKPQDVRYIGGYRSNNKDEKMWDAHFNEFFVAHKDVDVKDIKIQQSEVEQARWVDFEEFKRMVQSKDSSLTTKWEAFGALIKYMERKE